MSPLSQQHDKTSYNVTSILLDQIIPYFGCPKTIVTDPGVEKTLRSQTNSGSLLYKSYYSPCADPQSNGMVKRRQLMLLNFAC